MALPNVQELTQKLATMSDQQMQQYAQMHKDDPYVLAMAVSEKTRRAAMRNAAQPQAPQPTVADAEISDMAPPPAQAGLSALPAQNLENMEAVQASGGGVLGFEQGGLYEIPGMVTGDPRLQELLRGRDETAAPEEKKLLPAFWEALMSGKTVSQVRGEPAAASPGPAVAPPPAAPAPAPLTGGLQDLAKSAGAAIDATPSRPAGLPAGAARPQAPVPASPAPSKTAAASAAPAEPKVDIVARAREALAPSEETRKELIEREKGLTDADIAAAREQLAQFDKRNQAAAPVGAEREARLRKQEAGLFSEEGHALGNAAMRGFLAIVAGTSRNRRLNIARGLAIGLNAFDKRMAQVDARRENINKNLDQIETLREQAASASAEKRAALEARIETLRSNGARSSYELFKSLGYDTDMTIGLESFKAAEAERLADKKMAHESKEKELDRASDARVAGIRAANSGTPKTFDLQTEYAKYYKSWQEQKNDPFAPKAPLKSIIEFGRDMGIMPVVNAPPGPGAVVLPRD